MDQLPSQSGAITSVHVNDGKPVQTAETGAAADHPGGPDGPSTIDAAGAGQPDARKNQYPAILDGTFFRVVSVGDDGNSVKAACVTCPVGKKPLSGTISSTTNFLLHIKVRTFLFHLLK